MLRSWRAERRIKLHFADEVAALPRDGRVAVVLSSCLARYAVLPWSPVLVNEDEWLAYARHSFASTHGAAAAGWTIRLSRAARGNARVACAIDTALLESLRTVRSVISVQPSLMAEFNARRAELAQGSAWLVLQESGRLLLALIAGGAWKLIRARQANGDWRERLPELLAREHAASGELSCERVVLCAEGG